MESYERRSECGDWGFNNFHNASIKVMMQHKGAAYRVSFANEVLGKMNNGSKV